VSDRSKQTREGLALAAVKGRKPGRKPRVPDARIRAVMHLGTVEGARKVGLSKSQFIVRRRRIEEGAIDDAQS
jgi:DNA invertase Pin-like site-specific DNA recombinase